MLNVCSNIRRPVEYYGFLHWNCWTTYHSNCSEWFQNFYALTTVSRYSRVFKRWVKSETAEEEVLIIVTNDREYVCSSLTSEYQYLQRSIVPTLHFQKSLPRLPIPELSKTADRYLKALRPLVEESKYLQTEKYVQSFIRNEGPPLQKELEEWDRNNKHTSYISEPWFNMYLSDRTPLPINYNPCLIFVNHGKPFYDEQLYKTANLLISSLRWGTSWYESTSGYESIGYWKFCCRFYKSLSENLLEPEVFHLNPKKSNTPLFRRFTSLLPSSISWYGAYLMKVIMGRDFSRLSNVLRSE